MAGGSVITPDLLSPVFGGAGMSPEGGARARPERDAGEAVDRLEREMIEGALERAAGNISQTRPIAGPHPPRPVSEDGPPGINPAARRRVNVGSDYGIRRTSRLDTKYPIVALPHRSRFAQ